MLAHLNDDNLNLEEYNEFGSSFWIVEKWLNQQEVALSLKYRLQNKFKFVRLTICSYFGGIWKMWFLIICNVQIYITTSYLKISSCVSCAYVELLSTREVWRARKRCKSLLSALQTSQVLNISTYAQLTHELIVL